MQERFDDQEIQVKKMAKFDVAKEQELKRLSVYEFLFHLMAVREED